MTAERTVPSLHLQTRLRYALARSGLLLVAVAVLLLIGVTGSGTEGQPVLLVWLCVVLGVFVAVGAAVAVVGWRLTATLVGSELTVRAMRARTVDLSRVERIGWRGAWPDGPSMRFAETTDRTGRHRVVELPLGTAMGGGGSVWRPRVVSAWHPAELDRLLTAVYQALPDEVTFAGPAAAMFAEAGCPVEGVD